MKYLRLFEEFEDELSPLTRDMFDLRSHFSLGNSGDITVDMYGPSESEHQIKELVRRVLIRQNEQITPEEIQRELAETGWTGECSMHIGGPYSPYVIKGPFHHLRMGMIIREEIQDLADLVREKADKTGDTPDEDLDDAYDQSIAISMEDPETLEEIAAWGFTLQKVEED